MDDAKEGLRALVGDVAAERRRWRRLAVKFKRKRDRVVAGFERLRERLENRAKMNDVTAQLASDLQGRLRAEGRSQAYRNAVNDLLGVLADAVSPGDP